MLSFLLDEHISPGVGTLLTRTRPEMGVLAFVSWDGGDYPGEDDEQILQARKARLTLVT